MQTPRTGTRPVKCRIASRETPESVIGCPGPGEMMRARICRRGRASGLIASLRITVTSAPRRVRCWYRFQVKESKLSIMRTSRGRARCSGRDMAIRVEAREIDPVKFASRQADGQSRVSYCPVTSPMHRWHIFCDFIILYISNKDIL